MTPLLFMALAIEFAPAGTNLRFVLENAPTPEKHMLETMPGGIAVFDYNNDGKADIFFANGAELPALRKTSAKYHNRLFRNDGGWKFTDVTVEAGLAGEGYAMGASAGDFDGDGHVDLFVAGVYRNALYRNLGNGKFADATAASGILSNEWSVAGGWFDFDNDGKLDLLVTNYGRIDLKNPRSCGTPRIYCHPKYYEPRPNQLYRNLGGGKFADVSASSGIAAHLGRGMSIAFADYDADGRMDAFVTNDNLPNFLFHNLGKGKFEETALLGGVALLDHGKPVASMGTDFRDFDNDGRPDVVVTALNGETFPLFRNQGGTFQDATASTGLGRLTNQYSGWGVGLVDFDNDGWKDLFTANSHVNDLVEKFEAATYRQANTVFRNQNGKFVAAVTGLEKAVAAHRGAAFADFDNDGRIDVVVTVLGAPAELWRNVSPVQHWLGVKVDVIGTRIRIGTQVNQMSTSVSYASSVHGPVHFGLGDATKVERIEITWPSGRTKTLTEVAVDQVITVRP